MAISGFETILFVSNEKYIFIKEHSHESYHVHKIMVCSGRSEAAHCNDHFCVGRLMSTSPTAGSSNGPRMGSTLTLRHVLRDFHSMDTIT